MEFQSVIRRTRSAKIQALANRFAVAIAKERNDPTYKKYKMFRDKFIDSKKMLGRKYKAVAMKQARAAITTGKGTKPPDKSKSK